MGLILKSYVQKVNADVLTVRGNSHQKVHRQTANVSASLDFEE